MKHSIPDINDELLVKYLLDEATPVESERVTNWIHESPVNLRYFRQFEHLWQQSKIIEANISVDEDAAWQRFQQRITTAGRVPSFKPVQQLPVLKIAATILVILSVTALLYFALFTTPQTILLTTSDNIATDTLPDQSIVTLNKNSSLDYSEQTGAGAIRKVKLKGEAFFAVAADKSRPFAIEVDSVLIRVVGTSFNVKEAADYTEIIVESGIVTVSKKNQTITLTKGEKIQVPHVGQMPGKAVVTDQLYSYYRSRQFVCDNTPLWKLAEVLSEAYDTPIIIDRGAIRDLRISTTFNDEPLDNVLKIVSETLDVKIEKVQGAIHIK